MSAFACRPTLASSSLYGSPATEKMGSFWLSTSELNTSIIGMPVWIIWSGIRRMTGLTGGDPMGTASACTSGLPSRGRPEPSKIRPSRSSENGTCMGCPRKRILSPVESPCVPEKTCNDTWSSLR